MRRVAGPSIDYVFDFQGLLRTGLVTSSPSKHKWDAPTAGGAGLFYKQKVPLPPGGRRSHRAGNFLQFCPLLGAKPELRGPPRFKEAESLI